jgi:SAM-dependent methyltransferase
MSNAETELHCPLCGVRHSQFLPYGIVPRANAKCPSCGALERHRLSWLFLQQATDLFDGRPKRLLHFAPERALTSRLESLPGLDYVTADLHASGVALRLDIMDTQLPDESFDVIFCSHVLEHVPDDRQAMAECRRILKPGGWALILVPVRPGPTDEDRSVTDPAERERRFGQHDHMRTYGPDVAERLRATGLNVAVHTPRDVAGDRLAQYGIPAHEHPIFFCRKL